MATSSTAPLRPACLQHTVVDDPAGIVVDVESVTGEEHDTGRFDACMEAIETSLGIASGRITVDTIYRVGRVFAALEGRRIEAVIPAPIRSMGTKERAIYSRHYWRVEGAHGTARALHGLAQVVRRRRESMKIQAFLTAMAMNLKKRAAAMLLIWSALEDRRARPVPATVGKRLLR